jgi:hypothetical protein
VEITMRVNIYEEELSDQVEIVPKTSGFIGIRLYMHLPVTTDGQQLRGPFMHRPGDDDSSAVTFWAKDKATLQQMLQRALKQLDSAD